eukprot:724558-Pleurochrysis_carterae.AAC.3
MPHWSHRMQASPLPVQVTNKLDTFGLNARRNKGISVEVFALAPAHSAPCVSPLVMWRALT